MKSFRTYLIESVNDTDIEDEIISLFKDNEKVDDGVIHSLSGKLGIDTHIFEGYVYKLLSDFFHAGKALDFKGSFDPKQIEMGIKVEMEHTTNPKIAERIAKDHLSEIPDYYTRLAKMEKEAGITESIKEDANTWFEKGKFIRLNDIDKSYNPWDIMFVKSGNIYRLSNDSNSTCKFIKKINPNSIKYTSDDNMGEAGVIKTNTPNVFNWYYGYLK